jgi:plastocyanin
MTPRTVLRTLATAGAAAAVAAAPVSGAAPIPVPALAVSGPQGATVGFATPTVLSIQGQGLTLLNADTVGHTVTSKATRPKKVKFGKRYYIVRVPIFDSGNVAPAATGDVKGVTTLKPGSYEFFCYAHTGMVGTLIVNPGA